MAQASFYRYIFDPGEVNQIRNERKIKTMNPASGTWFTSIRYQKPGDAQAQLALHRQPTHRIGPIPADEMPDFDILLRPVAPANGQPGGGVEARTRTGEVIWIFGLYQFATGDYETKP